MANMSGKVKREFDAAAAATLRVNGDGAETADAAETGVALNVLKDAYWDNNEQPNGHILVSIDVKSRDFTTGDELYDLYFEVDTSIAFATPVEVARVRVTGGVGYYEAVLPASNIEKLEPGATHVRVRLDVAGTTPSIDYAAWMTFHGV